MSCARSSSARCVRGSCGVSTLAKSSRVPNRYAAALSSKLSVTLYLPASAPFRSISFHVARTRLIAMLQSHEPGAEKARMLEGIANHHASIKDSNPRWVLDLMWQLAELKSTVLSRSQLDCAPLTAREEINLSDFQDMVHKSSPWWI